MTASAAPFTPGYHYFCDHRCWRCPLAARCRVAAEAADAGIRAKTPAQRVGFVVLVALRVTLEDTTSMLANAPDAAGAALDSSGAGGTTEDTHSADADREAGAGVRATSDPLVVRARDYAQSSLRVLTALRPRLGRAGDADLADAAVRLEETCLTIASKVHRAVSSAIAGRSEADDVQSDANGSAKVALLLIEESRRAWQTLMRPGRALADGAPARFVAVLNELECRVHSRFPIALSFVRPGFDTAAAGCDADQVARAMLASGSARPS